MPLTLTGFKVYLVRDMCCKGGGSWGHKGSKPYYKTCVNETNLHYGHKACLLEDSKSKKGKKYKKRWGSKIKFSWCDSTGDGRAAKK